MNDYGLCIKNAIEFCLTDCKGYSSSKDIVDCLKKQDALLNSKFRYSIALDVAKFLIDRFGDDIISMKLYGSTMEYTAGLYSDIDMILHLSSSNSELLQTIKMINKYLTEEYYILIGQIADEFSYLLDMHIIDDDPEIPKHPSKAYLRHIFQYESVSLC